MPLNWLKRYILCYVYFITVKKIFSQSLAIKYYETQFSPFLLALITNFAIPSKHFVDLETVLTWGCLMAAVTVTKS